MSTPEQIAAGVWRAGTRYVNFYLVDTGETGVVLVDTGLPGYRRHLDDSLRFLGRDPSDVKAVLLTHGHIDHVGGAGHAAGSGAPVYLHPDDAELAEDPRRNRTQRSLVHYLHWPATAAFVGHALTHGVLHPPSMPASVKVADREELDVPGRPRVVHTPGHTAGSCVFDFPQHDVAFVGDLLCTADPFSGRHVAPQLQTQGSNADSDQAMQSLERLAAVDSRVILPGHGRPWVDGVDSAVSAARRVGCR